MIRKRTALTICLCALSLNLASQSFSTGFRAFVSVGQGSGKGFWDWTDPGSSGRLHPMPGAGAALAGKLSLSGGMILDVSCLYSFASAGQEVDDKEFLYYQHSIEFPLMLMGTPPIGKERLSIGLGPAALLLPFRAGRLTRQEGTESRAHQDPEHSVLLGIHAGADYRIPLSEGHDIVLSFRFVHPFTSPGYSWEERGSGNYRINRLDFGLGLFSRAAGKSHET